MSGFIQFLHRVRRVVLLVCAAAWTAAIATTHLPPRDLPSIEVSDKTLHTVGYCGLAGLLGLTLAAYGKTRPRRLMLMLVIMPVYGALDEWTQPYFGRSCEFIDWVFDVIGTIGAMILLEIALAALGRAWPGGAPEEHPL